MIQIQNLEVWVWEKQILFGIDMAFELGKNYCLLGKNGSGKSTLSSFLMGHPQYEYISGEVSLTSAPTSLLEIEEESNIEKQDLLEMSPNQRSGAWLFLSFQHVPEIGGILLSEYLRIIYNLHLKAGNPDSQDISPFIFKRFIKKHLEELHIEEVFLQRDLNVWFSGWEKRKIEILQMKLIGPKYIILDEIDSWLDLDAFRAVASLLKNMSTDKNSIIIITHYFTILDYVNVDEVYILEKGKVKLRGGKELIDDIKKNGFGK